MEESLHRCFDVADAVVFGSRTPQSNWQQDAKRVISQLTIQKLIAGSQGVEQMQPKGTVQ
jgi:hypothetical protein